MKVVQVKSEEQATSSIQFLKEWGSCNLYLYEGLSMNSSRHHNLLFYKKNTICGVLHTKTGKTAHILLSGRGHGDMTGMVMRAVLRRFGMIRSIFGDRDCIVRLAEQESAEKLSLREYQFMEVEKQTFKEAMKTGGVVPPIEDAPLLLPLQRQYEIEEMEVDASLLDPEKMTTALARRIGRGDVTALYEEGRPVAIAGVNSRYGETCQIGSVYVPPAYRRKGYGYGVVSSHVSRLLRRYSRIVLFVDVKNRLAARLYETIGFRKCGMLAQLGIKQSY